MAQVLRHVHNSPAVRHADLLVGIDGADDAGVYRLTPELALVQTVDFFTPIVDEADDWGRIAAANSLSDVYAMGGLPLTALQLVGWPRDRLPFDLLEEVIAGGTEVMAEAGCTVVGGHSIDDTEPKYGFAITGTVHPEEFITNGGGVPGDVLILTKPIGTGLIATGIKRGVVSQEVRDAAVDTMRTLNLGASRAMRRIGVKAATDVTGFGLLGHLGEMIRAGRVSAVLDAEAIPILPGAVDLAEQQVVPGGTLRNLEAVRRFTDFGDTPEPLQVVLADAQTSGGILMSVPRALRKAALQALEEEETSGAIIGAVVDRSFSDGPAGRVTVRGRHEG